MNLSPLILTLMIDNESQDFFNRLRIEHFPAKRNYVDAHLTLFHNLPQDNLIIENTLSEFCFITACFDMEATNIVSIGNGAAYIIESAGLQILHKWLQEKWQQWLIPQDKQKLWPHITIQNKTDAAEAAQLIIKLKRDFEPFKVGALGINLWEYKGGPWEFIRGFRFKY